MFFKMLIATKNFAVSSQISVHQLRVILVALEVASLDLNRVILGLSVCGHRRPKTKLLLFTFWLISSFKWKIIESEKYFGAGIEPLNYCSESDLLPTELQWPGFIIAKNFVSSRRPGTQPILVKILVLFTETFFMSFDLGAKSYEAFGTR